VLQIQEPHTHHQIRHGGDPGDVHDTHGYAKSARTLTHWPLMLWHLHKIDICGQQSLRPSG